MSLLVRPKPTHLEHHQPIPHQLHRGHHQRVRPAGRHATHEDVGIRQQDGGIGITAAFPPAPAGEQGFSRGGVGAKDDAVVVRSVCMCAAVS